MTGEPETLDNGIDPNAAVDPAPADTSEDDMGAIFDRLVTNNGADRGSDGKFTSADAAAPDAPPESAGEGVPADGAADASAAPVAGETAAPAHLPGGIKSEWGNIPEAARAAIAAHQSEMDRKFGEIGKQYGAVKPIADRLTEATSKYPEFAGMTPDQLAQGALELAAVQANLSKNPVGTIMEIAKHYNVLPQVAQAFQGQAGENEQTQLVTGLQQKIANLEAQLSQVSNPENIRETVSTAFAERETEALVQQFAAEDGKDYWPEVEADMPLYIQHVMERGLAEGPKAILQKAYDMAINANPDVRAKVRAAEVKATAAGADPKKAEAVRNAVSINVKSSNSGKERTMTEEEAMASAYDRAMAS